MTQFKKTVSIDVEDKVVSIKETPAQTPWSYALCRPSLSLDTGYHITVEHESENLVRTTVRHLKRLAAEKYGFKPVVHRMRQIGTLRGGTDHYQVLDLGNHETAGAHEMFQKIERLNERLSKLVILD